jgi:hypothetical protein
MTYLQEEEASATSARSCVRRPYWSRSKVLFERVQLGTYEAIDPVHSHYHRV